MESPRVLLADDLPGMLDTVTQLLRDDCEIVGYTRDGEDAIKAATTSNPDFLVAAPRCPAATTVAVAG